MNLESTRSGADCVTYFDSIDPEEMLAAGIVLPCLTAEMTEAQWGYEHFPKVISSGRTKF